MNSEAEKFKKIILESGRAALHATKPDEFEYYACTFELLNHDFEVESIFHFPVTPNSMMIDGQMLTSIRKMGSGYDVQFSNSYMGRNISISGTFGRRFRLLLNDGELKLRTGYGATKLMEEIMTKNSQLDASRKPRFLVFHNYAFNQSGIVEILRYSMSQSLENNMFWNWSIEMKMVGDVNKIITTKNRDGDLVRLLAENSINKSINDILGNVTLQSTVNTLRLPL